MDYIKAPFNFVPVSNNVFFPPWSQFISHDIPFKNGVSGAVELKIEACTPIFIRDAEDSSKFCNSNGDFFIPGTSIKGITRSVLEIFSFSKMDKINNRKYAIRDLNSPAYQLQRDSNNIRCGWLRKKGGENCDTLEVVDCGKPWRISYDNLRENTEFRFNIGRDQYKINNQLPNLDKYRFSKLQATGGRDNRIKCEIDHHGDEGVIVFTGKAVGRKKYEFVFPRLSNERIIPVPKTVLNDFKLNYYDSDLAEHEISPDWKWRKSQIERGGSVPIFFRIEQNQDVVKDFGLSYLYKMPYRYSTFDCLPKNHKNLQKLDLAESIFGFTTDNDSLKGRVQFLHAHAEPNTMEPVKSPFNTILGSPRASYYPIYLKQSGSNGYVDRGKTNRGREYPIYRTFQDDTQLSGWKKYILNSNYTDDEKVKLQNAIQEGKIKKEITTKDFYPLVKKNGKNPTFVSTVKFHNLLPQELGALLSAISLHNTENVYHSLGMGKPYGLGRVRITIKDLKVCSGEKNTPKLEDFLKSFELMMNEALGKCWKDTEQIKEFFALSEGVDEISPRVGYMSLGEFGSAKKITYRNGEINNNNGLYLEKFSEINPSNTSINSYTLKGEKSDILPTWEKKEQDRNSVEKEKTKAEPEKEKAGEVQQQTIARAVNKLRNNQKSITMAKIGDEFEAVVIEKNKVQMIGDDGVVEVQLVLNKAQKVSQPGIGEKITIQVKQIKKDGTINQVGLRS